MMIIQFTDTEIGSLDVDELASAFARQGLRPVVSTGVPILDGEGTDIGPGTSLQLNSQPTQEIYDTVDAWKAGTLTLANVGPITLQSPDGTLFTLTVTDLGALVAVPLV